MAELTVDKNYEIEGYNFLTQQCSIYTLKILFQLHPTLLDQPTHASNWYDVVTRTLNRFSLREWNGVEFIFVPKFKNISSRKCHCRLQSLVTDLINHVVSFYWTNKMRIADLDILDILENITVCKSCQLQIKYLGIDYYRVGPCRHDW